MEEKPKVKMKRLNVELTPDEHAEFKAYAAKKRMTMKELVETWIRQVVEPDETGRKGGAVHALVAEAPRPGYHAG